MPRRYVMRGFTLVELLVVIGIIALLIAIILPSLNKARQSATNIKCLANLHSMGLAMNLYATNNHGIIPPGFGAALDNVSGANSNNGNGGNFDDVLSLYMPGQARNTTVSSTGLRSSSNVFTCPGAVIPVLGTVAINYACSCASSINGQNMGGFAYLWTGTANLPPQPWTKLSQIRRPTEIIAIGDANQNYNDGQSYVDGGSWILLNYNAATGSPYASTASASTYNAYGPTTPNPGQKICTQGGNEDRTSPGVNTGLRFRHFEYHHNRDGVANVLFFDGHCSGIRFGDLLEKNIATSY
jgi:prepilin-type N-terminal cleavage/methylation domain-containing protein/prepilin-type processing-associated H-X9-DG protein